MTPIYPLDFIWKYEFCFAGFNTLFFVNEDEYDDHDAEKFYLSRSRLFLLSYLIASTYIYYKYEEERQGKEARGFSKTRVQGKEGLDE